MCTAISFKTRDHYFGRNLDLEYHYNESVVITPRNFPLSFRCKETTQTHYAMIGMAIMEDNYPLYYDATNEVGLSMAGLSFPENAFYFPTQETKDNITPFEFIPWILGQCKSVLEAKNLLDRINIVNIPFNEKFPLSPLHWIICDKECAVVVEQTKEGLAVYNNPIGVLTNNPPFPYHQYNVINYINTTASEPENRFSSRLTMPPYSRGMGGIGLPGDLSSPSRFVRAAFTKENSICDGDEFSSISQFFHILESVSQQRGCAQVGDGYEITFYSSCCNTETGVYYYKTYENSQITAVRLTDATMSKDGLTAYPLITTQQIRFEN